MTLSTENKLIIGMASISIAYSNHSKLGLLLYFETMEPISEKKYIGIYIGSIVLLILPLLIASLVFGLINQANNRQPSTALVLTTTAIYVLCVLQFFVVQIVYYFLILEKMWEKLQDDVTPVTVGKAVGFMFIPFFQLYPFLFHL
jgi:hypothetical protein